jgi:predicted  nucleic acid-binding Zn-ribbon protein
MAAKIRTDLNERIKIQEKALQELADRLERHGVELAEEVQDALEEIKAIKLFLSRELPDFRKQYPDLRKKIKKAA